MSRRRDYLAVAEAAYAAGASTEAWLQGLVDAMRSVVDFGYGAAAYEYDARDQAFHAYSFVESTDEAASLQARGLSCFSSDPIVAGRAHACLPRVGASEDLADVLPCTGIRAAMMSGGFGDALAVKAHDLRGFGCAIVIPSPSRIMLAPRTRAALTQVAAHFVAGSRLRGVLGEPLETCDAILRADGKVEHLNERAAREVLERAVSLRAQGQRLRREQPEQALALWRALVSGRWSLVDHVDRDGKRFVLARRNTPGAVTAPGLTANEHAVALFTAWGMSNKAITYELGLAPSTVSGLLSSSMRKLRVRTRRELALMLGWGGAAKGAATSAGGRDDERQAISDETASGGAAQRPTGDALGVHRTAYGDG
jgi:DNA-binding NarL/FixJ family response regulator